ncbi:MAG: NAD-dependent epimerase/dehydratase family protein [Deltaproteobacteria bacterium]|nr:NAD-dependent epimerase/dehydratase family protein [Deltaproteobacteria bacterium]
MNLASKKIVVIGGAGFIGSHIVDLLLKTAVAQVVIFDNFSRGSLGNIRQALKDPRVVVMEGADILHTDILNQALKGAHYVFHLAAVWLLQCHEYPKLAFDVNIRGTFNVIEAALRHKVEKVIFSSSASVYGDALSLPMTEDHPYNNFTFYGATKIAGEHMFKSLGHQYGLTWIGLRYMNAYGPRQDYKGAYTAVMHKMLDRIESGKPPIIHGNGQQQYDFIDARDIARANICALTTTAQGECYNICRGIGTTLNDLAHLLLKLKNTNLDIHYEPQEITFVTKRLGCPQKAERDLHFKWKIDLEEGLRDLIAWRTHHQREAL